MAGVLLLFTEGRRSGGGGGDLADEGVLPVLLPVELLLLVVVLLLNPGKRVPQASQNSFLFEFTKVQDEHSHSVFVLIPLLLLGVVLFVGVAEEDGRLLGLDDDEEGIDD